MNAKKILKILLHDRLIMLSKCYHISNKQFSNYETFLYKYNISRGQGFCSREDLPYTAVISGSWNIRQKTFLKKSLPSLVKGFLPVNLMWWRCDFLRSYKQQTHSKMYYRILKENWGWVSSQQQFYLDDCSLWELMYWTRKQGYLQEHLAESLRGMSGALSGPEPMDSTYKNRDSN